MFTGLFYRNEIAEYYRANNLPEPYDETALRKIIPETLQQRVLDAFRGSITLFRKTSCAVSFVHDLPDYNGHIGIPEICDICPLYQVNRCRAAHRTPTSQDLYDTVADLPEALHMTVDQINNGAAVVGGLENEQPRYYLQHQLGFQIHDVRHPHHQHRHGRSDIGWEQRATP